VPDNEYANVGDMPGPLSGEFDASRPLGEEDYQMKYVNIGVYSVE